MLLLIMIVIAVTGGIIRRRIDRKITARGAVLTGGKKLLHDLLSALWITGMFFGLAASFFLTVLVYDYYRIFTEKRTAYVTEMTGITAGENVDFKKYMRAFGGPDGSTLQLIAETALTPAEFMSGHCKGVILTYTEGDTVYYSNRDTAVPLSNIGSSKELTAYYEYTWNSKRFFVMCTGEDGKTVINIRY